MKLASTSLKIEINASIIINITRTLEFVIEYESRRNLADGIYNYILEYLN